MQELRSQKRVDAINNRLEAIYNDRLKFETLQNKYWGIIDLISSFDIKLDIKDLLDLTDRISVKLYDQ